mgnify:CR=1 FL=1
MEETNKKQWITLHKNTRYRPKYPAEIVVQFVFRNFLRDGKTKILDLGCGAGRHVFFMGNEKIIPYGVDFSDEGIEYTKEMLKEYGLNQYIENMKVASLTDLPFEEGVFDGIICYGVLYYLDIQNIKKAVREMNRVLKKGGKVLLVVRTIDDYRYQNGKQVSAEKNTIIVDEASEGKCAHSENGMLMHFFEEKELRELFSEFANVTIDYIKETHDNETFCDCNYVLVAEK